MHEPSGRYAYYGASYDVERPVDSGVDARYAHQCCEHEEPPSSLVTREPDGHCECEEYSGVRWRERRSGFIDKRRDSVHDEGPRVIIEKLDGGRDDATRKNDRERTFNKKV